ncbi:L-asparaginase [Spironucleus salmonicida]|uniref:asparaginase n=1 Tax=Spironucleus salmonicida TaxID=348837 RepID=V6LPW2_9EUKA|nr:L-asparaginase [Spironucleus salmonicida]|eukprot:EST42794.1 L-asparaginase [Spironucleus salmonicida]
MNTKLLCPMSALPSSPSKSIAIIYTGGTIGMSKTQSNTFHIDHDIVKNSLESNPIFHHAQMPPFMLFNLETPLISYQMDPGSWMMIGNAIFEIYEHFRGFVIIHGTDTLAYTASALSFMFKNLQKHIVFTGSQLPLSNVYSDAYFNLAGSILVASQLQIPEVTVFFSNKLYRANRVQKYSAWSLDAFDSAQMQPLAEFGTSLSFRRDLVRNFKEEEYGNGDFSVDPVSSKVGMVYLVPGIKVEMLDSYNTYKGLILQVFGAGNGGDAQVCKKLKQLHDGGCVIGLVSQTHTSMISVGAYEASNQLREAGCISGRGMTPEAAFTKLCWLMQRDLDQREIEELFQQSLRGEQG